MITLLIVVGVWGGRRLFVNHTLYHKALAQMRVCMDACVRARVCVCVCAYMRARVWVKMCVCVGVCVWVHVWMRVCGCVCRCVRGCMCLWTSAPISQLWTLEMDVH